MGQGIDRRLLLAVGGAALMGTAVRAEPGGAFDSAGIDRLVADFMRAFDIPGVGVGVVQTPGAVFKRGYGVRTLGEAARVDEHTQFAIASNSKAFTGAALAMLVDAGKIRWEDPIIRHMPDFQMYDPAVTAMMTVRDLLLHRSGLPLGAGDLMQFPKSDRTREEFLHALRYLKPATGFRDGYAYDNILYIVAGLLVERVSGVSWDQFVATRIFTPLGMTDAVTNITLLRGSNHAGRHARLGPPVIGMGPLEVVQPDETAAIAPAGGIQASVSDAVAWLQVQLGRGVSPNGTRLWSERQSAEMWRPQTITASGPGPTADAPQRSVISAYALGWGVSDYRGRRMLSHAGGLVGQITRTTLLPDLGLGFVVYSNIGDSDPVSGLRYAIMDHLLGAPAFDWLAATRTQIQKTEVEVRKAVGSSDFKTPAGGPSLPLDRYVGRYRDPWYGDIVVSKKDDGLFIDFTRTPIFKSRLEPFGADAFRTRFPREAGENALVRFDVAGGHVAGVTMKALSPLADFSFDFQDLAFKPVP